MDTAIMRYLPLTFASQVKPGALLFNNDCLAAAEKTLASGYNLATDMAVDDIYKSIRGAGGASGNIPLWAPWAQLHMAQLGLLCNWKAGLNLNDVFNLLVEEKPILALIHYAPIVERGYSQFKDFTGGHFVVIAGIDIKNLAIFDPYRDDVDGPVEIPHTVFMVAWEQATLDENSPCGGLIPSVGLRDLSGGTPAPASHTGTAYRMKAVVKNSVNLRESPYGKIIGSVWRVTDPIVYVDRVDGNYGHLADNSGWVWIGSDLFEMV